MATAIQESTGHVEVFLLQTIAAEEALPFLFI